MIIGIMTILIIVIFISIIVILTIAAPILIHLPQFGKTPSGARLERIKQSPNFRKGQFYNQQPVEILNLKNLNCFKIIHKFIFDKRKDVTPTDPLPTIKQNLKQLDKEQDFFVWFGHSSYLLSLHGTTFLVDPTFCTGAPFKFINKPFKTTSQYLPEDMPDHIEYLVITHDHYDHLDYQTFRRLKSSIGQIICPLGVGAHMERWGAEPEQIIELDWYQHQPLTDTANIFCLPAQHFSGRALKRNNTLWASFLLKTHYGNIFIGCDGGYGPHFKEIGKQHPKIDLAILENGQYDKQWQSMHTLPSDLGLEALDLNAKQIITIHHSKYALAHHPWNEPRANEIKARDDYNLNLIIANLGQPMELHLTQ